jgi:hypothetical protein
MCGAVDSCFRPWSRGLPVMAALCDLIFSGGCPRARPELVEGFAERSVANLGYLYRSYSFASVRSLCVISGRSWLAS